MWIYAQASGALYKDGERVDVGYSGFGAGRNAPALEAVHDVGPIPCGVYTIGAPIDQFGGPHGPFVLPLTPDPTNEMYDRGGFLIHGDRIGAAGTASHGCLIFARATREAIAGSGDNRLQVVKEIAAT